MKYLKLIKPEKLLLVVALIAIPAIVTYSQDRGQLKIPLSNPGQPGELRVDINSGSITVIGTDVNEVIVDYIRRERKVKEKEKTRDGLTRINSNTIDLEAYEKNNQVVVESDSWNGGVDLEIQVPINFNLYLEAYNNGDVFAKNIVGEIEAENYNGKITLENISGSVVAETYNGSIIVIFDKVTPDTPMAFSNYNGNIDLSFPSSTPASFKMKTKQGDIYEGFGMDISEVKPVVEQERKSDTYMVKVDEWVRGTINGGGPEVVIQSYNGNIYIRKGN